MSSSVSSNPGKQNKRGKKAPSNYIPKGDILTDSHKQLWIIHGSIGRGGFGEIYTASSAKDKNQQNYVIKIEPSENGPLFCEKTVYIRIGKFEDIKEYMATKKLKSLGMPKFFGSGLHSTDGKKFRFLVMERYGKDLWSIFLESKRKFPPATIFKVGLQVLEVLEYIHSKGYVHADIKGANLLLGRTKNDENQVYLVDFGLASRYTSQLKSDPRRAHNGTIEYTSRDGHNGVVTRRGDIEILGYNLLHWASSNLPWEGLKDVYDVHAKKEKYMKDLNNFLNACYEGKTPSRTLEKYFVYLIDLHPLAEPDYELLKQYLREGIKKTGDTNIKLDFHKVRKSRDDTSSSPSPAKVRKTTKRIAKNKVKSSTTDTYSTSKVSSEEENDDEEDDDFIDSTPEKSPIKFKKKTTKCWKDCDTVVSCAELLHKDSRTLRRSKRSK